MSIKEACYCVFCWKKKIVVNCPCARCRRRLTTQQIIFSEPIALNSWSWAYVEFIIHATTIPRGPLGSQFKWVNRLPIDRDDIHSITRFDGRLTRNLLLASDQYVGHSMAFIDYKAAHYSIKLINLQWLSRAQQLIWDELAPLPPMGEGLAQASQHGMEVQFVIDWVQYIFQSD